MATFGHMRIDPYDDADAYGYLRGLHAHLARGPLGAELRELVNVRVSQINGCGFCLALHARFARRAGVTQDKLDVLAGWREAINFDAREGAALGLAEAIARIGDGRRIDDAVWSAATACFDESEITALVYTVTLIDAFNRINVAVEMTADIDAFLAAAK